MSLDEQETRFFFVAPKQNTAKWQFNHFSSEKVYWKAN